MAPDLQNAAGVERMRDYYRVYNWTGVPIPALVPAGTGSSNTGTGPVSEPKIPQSQNCRARTLHSNPTATMSVHECGWSRM